MTMLQHGNVHNPFVLFDKRQVDIAPKKVIGNTADNVGLGQYPIFGNSRDDDAPKDPNPVLSS